MKRSISSKSKRTIFLCLAIIFFLAPVKSRVLAEIIPEGKDPLELYYDEVGRYEIRLINLGDSSVGNLVLKVVANGDLVLIDGLAERSEQIYSLGPINPKSERRVYIKVKCTQKTRNNSGETSITIYYGDRSYSHYVGTYVKPIQGPLEVKANLKKPVINKGEENRLELEIKNILDSELVRDVSVSVRLSEGLHPNEIYQVLSEISGGELVKKSFHFSSFPDASGTQHIAVNVYYRDSQGYHTIEKNLTLEVQDARFGAVVILSIVLVLIILYMFFVKENRTLPDKSKEA
ncbi:MAG: hypothetical protein QXM75_04045 [Candidatus Diapherotrites archaeon]